jgi:hypothetical protein
MQHPRVFGLTVLLSTPINLFYLQIRMVMGTPIQIFDVTPHPDPFLAETRADQWTHKKRGAADENQKRAFIGLC